MRLMKKKIDAIVISVELLDTDDKHSSSLHFSYNPETERISIDRYGIEELSVAEAQDMFKVLIDLCPKLASAISDALRGTTKF